MNFYKRYLGEYARDTAHLSLTEHGAYTSMLDTYYATEKPLPVDKTALYRIAKALTGAERKAVDRVAEQFFPVNGDGTRRHNKRADEELAVYRAQADTNRRIAVEREVRRKEHETHNEANTNRSPKPEARSKRKTPIPENFGISDRVTAWALEKGIFNLEAHLPYFVNQCKAKGYRNIDWDRAFMNAVSDDWAKAGNGAPAVKKVSL